MARSMLKSNMGRTAERSLAHVENIVENLRFVPKKMERLRSYNRISDLKHT